MNSNHERALRAIAGGARTPSKLRSATSTVSWPLMQSALLELIGMGHVSRGPRQRAHADRHRARADRAAAAAADAAYVPPKLVVARPGARDWERIPSLVGGEEQLPRAGLTGSGARARRDARRRPSGVTPAPALACRHPASAAAPRRSA
jgi:hypothetical protein